MTYKYFCNDCGTRFTSELPEKNPLGLLNDICCPDCGSYDCYTDDEKGSREAFEAYCEEEEIITYGKSSVPNDYYSYKELRDKALAHTATKEDLLNLVEWFDRFGTMYWNGECYDMDDGSYLYPIYEENEDGNFDLVDAEIR